MGMMLKHRNLLLKISSLPSIGDKSTIMSVLTPWRGTTRGVSQGIGQSASLRSNASRPWRGARFSALMSIDIIGIFSRWNQGFLVLADGRFGPLLGLVKLSTGS